MTISWVSWTAVLYRIVFQGVPPRRSLNRPVSALLESWLWSAGLLSYSFFLES